MHYTKDFSVLYGKSRTGKIKEWSISVISDDVKVAKIVTKHGYIDGKKQVDTVEVTKGKNIGKANETSPIQQAVSEAESKWNKKKDKGYSVDKNNILSNLLPMLAKNYNDYKHNITYPCFVQPKLNGVRCLTKRVNGEIEFISRMGKKYETLPHISKQLKEIMKVADIFDGEIYVHGECFQDIMSGVKNVKNKDKATLDSNKLKYYMYDVADTEMDFQDRIKYLQQSYLKVRSLHNDIDLSALNLVDTYTIIDEEQMKKLHDAFVKNGYEGAILRNKKGVYEFDYRSNNLQKYKEFKDEEYKIIDVKSGKGRYKDCGIFICKTKNGKQFAVTPEGTIERKKQYQQTKTN